AIGLSTLAAFAAPLIAEDDSTHVVAAIDARHDQVYLQVFGIGGRAPRSPRGARLREAARAGRAPPGRPARSRRQPAAGGGGGGAGAGAAVRGGPPRRPE